MTDLRLPAHVARVTSVGSAYDEAAERYRDHWGPVIAPTALRLLDRIAPLVDRLTDAQLADVGTGTGILAVTALQRWPTLHATGIDPSSGMRALAHHHADAAGVADRLSLLAGDAQSIPLPDAAVDVAVSSFVLQLVPDRAAALREIRRILRPGGWLAVVTWLDETREFDPLHRFDDLADEWDLPEGEGGYDTEPFASVVSAEQELRDAGFTDVEAEAQTLEHAFTPAGYLALLENWERDDVFDPLDEAERAEVREETMRRWSDLREEAFIWRAAVVSVIAKKAAR